MASGAEYIVTPVAVTVTTAGTRVQLSSTAILADNLVVQAKTDNAGIIFVGDSNVSASRGLSLLPGQSASFEGSRRRDGSDWLDLSSFWIDSASNGDGINWSYFKR